MVPIGGPKVPGGAAQTGAEVVVTHAVGLLVKTAAGPVPSTAELHDELRARLEGEWTGELRAAGAPAASPSSTSAAPATRWPFTPTAP